MRNGGFGMRSATMPTLVARICRYAGVAGWISIVEPCAGNAFDRCALGHPLRALQPVRFLLRHEADDRTRFIGAWTPTGLTTAATYGLGRADLERTYLVIVEGRALVRSDAGFALLGHLKAPWRWLTLLRVVPRPLRDLLYNLVARHRYRWFGTTETCLVPSPESLHRFTLD